MKDVSLADAATVTIIVHGVGDHSGIRILWSAEKGFRAFSGADVKSEQVQIPSLPELENIYGQPGVGLAIESGGQNHLVIPMVWSRLRPRAANEADFHQFQPISHLFNRLFQSSIFLLPACVNAIRCIPAAKSLVRRLLVTAIASCYGIFVPSFLICLFLFVCYLTTLRVSLDKEHHLWWRWPMLLIILWLLYWLAVKVLMVFDFVGDVVGYVGNAKLRRKAEERLLGVIRKLASSAPDAKILVVGHSLGSVLVTQSVPQLRGNEGLGGRLNILTMGSPLRLMSWFFPGRVLSPEKVLDEFDKEQCVVFWANMWRDADVVGRWLKIASANTGTAPEKFAEICLGDGTHTDYWADQRCWQAVANYLRAVAEKTVLSLKSTWSISSESPLSDAEKTELYKLIDKRNGIAFGFYCTFCLGFMYLGYVRHWSNWFPPICLIAVFVTIGAYRFQFQTISMPNTLIRLGWYNLEKMNVPGSIQRELLARNRIGHFIEKTCFVLTCAIGTGTALSYLLWKLFKN